MNTTLKEETLGQRLKAARIRKNMTQEELAEAMLTTKSIHCGAMVITMYLIFGMPWNRVILFRQG